jgi:hypothetical protein
MQRESRTTIYHNRILMNMKYTMAKATIAPFRIGAVRVIPVMLLIVCSVAIAQQNPCCMFPGNSLILNLNTGQAGGGGVDLKWKVNGMAAYVTSPNPMWLAAPFAPAQWIQPVLGPTPSDKMAYGLYKYEIQFTIPQCASAMSVRLAGTFAADNSAKAYLDGSMIASCPGPVCFNSPQAPVLISALVVTPGTHVLKIDVTNNSVGFSGLIVKAQLTGVCPPPVVLPGHPTGDVPPNSGAK